MTRRPSDDILRSVNDLVSAVTQLVSNVARTAGRAAAAGARDVVEGARRPAAEVTEKSKRLRTAVRAHWASLSPRERAERVKRMLAGRGLAPRAAGKAPGRRPAATGRPAAARKSARLRSAVKAHWASMSPQARADRVKRMLAGRGLKPKS
jgi:hypothetical protein